MATEKKCCICPQEVYVRLYLSKYVQKGREEGPSVRKCIGVLETMRKPHWGPTASYFGTKGPERLCDFWVWEVRTVTEY